MIKILQGDCLDVLKTMPDNSVHCCVTSPPYWGLRDYGTGVWMGGDLGCKHVVGEMRRGLGLATSAATTRGGGHKAAECGNIAARAVCPHCGAWRVDQQIGLEHTPEEYVARMVEVFREVRRVLRGDGTCWVNLGDSYANDGKWGGETGGGKQAYLDDSNRKSVGREKRLTGLKPKDLCGMPWRVAFALQADGWWLRSDIIWHKINPMPESVTDRPTKAHEYIFLLTKAPRYFYDAEAIKEPVNGGAHARKANGANSRMVTERAAGREESKPNPSRGNIQQPTSNIQHPIGKALGVGPKTAAAGSGIKANDSYQAAMVEMVGSRNKRDVWSIASAPYSEAHFATFPPDLIKPCILAGTSARGCCPKCGSPWERIVEKSGGTIGKGSWVDHDLDAEQGVGQRTGSRRNGEDDNGSYRVETKGWQPTCTCGAKEIITRKETIPCTVLDPFGGSGTTGAVALELGRRAVLIELNPEYVKMAERRCHVTPGLALA